MKSEDKKVENKEEWSGRYYRNRKGEKELQKQIIKEKQRTGGYK